MLIAIARFEWRYQSRAAALWVSCALFSLLTFGSITISEIQIGGPSNTHVNAPFAVLRTLSVLSVFAVFAVVAIVANVVLRDDETRFAPIIRATALSKRDYLLGRFVGASAALLPIYAAIPPKPSAGAPSFTWGRKRLSGSRHIDGRPQEERLRS